MMSDCVKNISVNWLSGKNRP